MQNNVIYLSDASFDPYTKEAGLGIKNLYTGHTDAMVTHAVSVLEAEEFALLEAINHAQRHGHKNCVFVFDNININTKSIAEFFSPMFEKIQFLWMKREYLHDVDVLAHNVRSKDKPNSLMLTIHQTVQGISDEELVATFMPLTSAETYGYLCAISDVAPMPKALPKNLKGVNEKIVGLLMHVGSKTLLKQLKERFKGTQTYKYKSYEALLDACGFSMKWFEEAKHECRMNALAA
ncbi:MAG: ribonuclease H family protein [Sulfuricurvum sp.]